MAGSAVPTIVWSSIASSRPDITAASSSRWRLGVSCSASIYRELHVDLDMSSPTCRDCHVGFAACPSATRSSGMLAVRPGTGYELAQRFDGSMSNAWHASHSQIYPELAKLSELGMVEVVGEGARRIAHLRGDRRGPLGAAPLDARDRPEPRPAQRDRRPLVPARVARARGPPRRARTRARAEPSPTTRCWRPAASEMDALGRAAPVPPDRRPRRAHRRGDGRLAAPSSSTPRRTGA